MDALCIVSTFTNFTATTHLFMGLLNFPFCGCLRNRIEGSRRGHWEQLSLNHVWRTMLLCVFGITGFCYSIGGLGQREQEDRRGLAEELRQEASTSEERVYGHNGPMQTRLRGSPMRPICPGFQKPPGMSCHQAGSLNFDTWKEKCSCKQNVEGDFCDKCKPGTIILYKDNPLGCQSCFCFGKTTECREQEWNTAYVSLFVKKIYNWP